MLNVKLDKLPDSLNEKVWQSALKPTMEDWTKAFTGEVKQGFEQEKTPGGENWEPLSPNYARWKAKQPGVGSKILTFHGKLKGAALSPATKFGQSDSGQAGASDDNSLTVTLSVNDIKAATHEFGRGSIKPRPFFTVTGDAKERLRKELQKKLFELVTK